MTLILLEEWGQKNPKPKEAHTWNHLPETTYLQPPTWNRLPGTTHLEPPTHHSLSGRFRFWLITDLVSDFDVVTIDPLPPQVGGDGKKNQNHLEVVGERALPRDVNIGSYNAQLVRRGLRLSAVPRCDLVCFYHWQRLFWGTRFGVDHRWPFTKMDGPGKWNKTYLHQWNPSMFNQTRLKLTPVVQDPQRPHGTRFR